MEHANGLVDEESGAAAVLARLRSGTAARLAGVPVATLRVWERRYGVVAAPKSATGQRLYSSHDVQRLRLMRQLSERGHPIGTVALLALGELRALADASPRTVSGVQRVVVVGRAVAQTLRSVPGCSALAVHDDLADAARAADADTRGGEAADLLLVQLPSLQPESADRVQALASRWPGARVMVLYAFGTEALADRLRAAGATVRREPVGGRELARLISPPATAPSPVPLRERTDAPLAVAARRFSDETLAGLAEMPSPVACECPRHLAEMVLQLAGFERYSAECASRGPADAALHRELTRVAATARTMFEQALEQVVAHEQLLLPGTTAVR